MKGTAEALLAFQTAQTAISCEIVGILIDSGVIPAEEAAERFRDASGVMATSDGGFLAAQMLAAVAGFVERKHPSARSNERPS